MELILLESGISLEIEGLRITPVAVNHAIPTLGFILQEGGATVVMAMDTGPTEEIWQRANAAGNVRAIFIEAAFPNEMLSFAKLCKHMTPELVGREVKKLRDDVRIIAVHLKPQFHPQVSAELQNLGIANLQLANSTQTYRF